MGALRLRFWFLCAALITVSVPATAGATFPGANGRIVYSSEGECTASYCFRQLYTVVPGDNPVRITDPQGRDEHPAWSADGRKIAFERTTDRIDMHVVDAEGTNHLDLIQDDRFVGQLQPAWAPDGRRLAYIRYPRSSPGFGGDLHLFDTHDSSDSALDVGRPLNFPESPSWRPDGERIAFVALVDGPGAVYSVNEDGNGMIRHSPLGLQVFSVDWSPDGSKLAFSGTTEPFERNPQIYTIDADGTDLARLTNTTGLNLDPAWSPDGTKIVFVSNRNYERLSIWTMRTDGSDQIRVASSAGLSINPDWQPLNRPPDCGGVVATRAELEPANRRLVSVTLTGARDPDGDPDQLAIRAVTQDEPVSGPGDPTRPDAALLTDEGSVALRAERNPHEDGRVYRIAFELTDGRGGECSGQVTVSVARHKQSPAVDSAPPSYDSLAP